MVCPSCLDMETHALLLKTTKLVLEKFRVIVGVFATLFLLLARLPHSCRFCLFFCELRFFLISLRSTAQVRCRSLNPEVWSSSDEPELLGLIPQPVVTRLYRVNLFQQSHVRFMGASDKVHLSRSELRHMYHAS
jgi:hypothetical protein